MEPISLLISSLSGARDLAGLLLNERDRQKAAAIQVDLTEKLIHAQAQLSQVLGTIIEKDAIVQRLTQRNSELEAAQREKERYHLCKVGAVGDFFAYGLRAAAELRERADEPPHFLCQPCFDAGRKAVLRVGKLAALCPVCRTSFAVASRPAQAGYSPAMDRWP